MRTRVYLTLVHWCIAPFCTALVEHYAVSGRETDKSG
jgi:hypothetical protein